MDTGLSGESGKVEVLTETLLSAYEAPDSFSRTHAVPGTANAVDVNNDGAADLIFEDLVRSSPDASFPPDGPRVVSISCQREVSPCRTARHPVRDRAG